MTRWVVLMGDFTHYRFSLFTGFYANFIKIKRNTLFDGKFNFTSPVLPVVRVVRWRR